MRCSRSRDGQVDGAWDGIRRHFEYAVGGQLYRGKNVKQEVLLITGQVHRSRAMQNTSDNADRGLESAGKHPLDGATPRRLGSRTAAAGSEFLKAVGSDLASLVAQLRHSLSVKRERPTRIFPLNAAGRTGDRTWEDTAMQR